VVASFQQLEHYGLKALEARKSWKPSTPAKPPRKRAVGKKKLARKKT
jgi:hypothetical protein